MITFELCENDKTAELHLDDDGIVDLISLLNRLMLSDQPQHFHMMTEEWGGTGLSSSKQNANSTLLNSVTLWYWPKSKELRELR